jgi:ribonuclease T2
MHRSPFALAVLLAAAPAAAQEPGNYVLALSAQPAFCEGHADRPECGALDPEAPAVRTVALHGLWPQQRVQYCNVPDDFPGPDADWSALQPLDLDPALEAELGQVMPGVASHLDRHEWYEHGSCTHSSAEAYYRESVDLVRQAWALPSIRALADVQGRTLSRDDLEALLAPDFGAVRLTVVCESGLFAELQLQLSRRGRSALSIPDDLRAGEIRFRDCPDEILIDAPGQ